MDGRGRVARRIANGCRAGFAQRERGARHCVGVSVDAGRSHGATSRYATGRCSWPPLLGAELRPLYLAPGSSTPDWASSAVTAAPVALAAAPVALAATAVALAAANVSALTLATTNTTITAATFAATTIATTIASPPVAPAAITAA